MDPNQPNHPTQVPPQTVLSPPQPQGMPGQVAGFPPVKPTAPAICSAYNPAGQPTDTDSTLWAFRQFPQALKSKKILIIAAAVAVLLTSKGGTSNPVPNLTNTIKGNSDIVDRKGGTLDLSTRVDKQVTIKAQDLKAKLNQQANLSDGTSYMVTNVERNWTSTSRYLQASTGKELMKIAVVVGNKNKEGNTYVTSSLFKIKNSAGGLQDSEFVSDQDLPDALKGQDVAPGKQVKGAIIFTVDNGEKISVLVTNDKYKNYTTNQEIIVNSEVALE